MTENELKALTTEEERLFRKDKAAWSDWEKRPASYRISAAGTVLTALYAAGGPSEVGSLRRILVRRSGQIVDSLDAYDYLLRGDATRDVRLENGPGARRNLSVLAQALNLQLRKERHQRMRPHFDH